MGKPTFILLMAIIFLATACSADNSIESKVDILEPSMDSVTVDDYQIINSTLVHLVLSDPEDEEREFGYDNFLWDEERKELFKDDRIKLHIKKYLLNPLDSNNLLIHFDDPDRIVKASNDTTFQRLIRKLAKKRTQTIELNLQNITNTGLYDLVSVEKNARINHDSVERGVVSFSRIIYNDSKDKAVFYFEYLCGGFCSYGVIVLVENEHGIWRIKQEISHWRS